MPFKKGNTIWKARKHTEATKKKMSENQLGPKNSGWKGGRTISDGYVKILCKGHPYCDINGYVKEERLIMEAFLNRYLDPTEIIHHKNKITVDNRIENLQIVTNSEHMKIHKCGTYIRTKEIRQKLSASHKGRKATEEAKKKISKANQGENHYMYGKKQTEEHKRNRSIAVKKWWAERKKKNVA